jgi:hypothetical protein
MTTIASAPPGTAQPRDMEVPLWRLYLLRAMALLGAVNGFFVHPQWMFDPSLTNRGMILGFTAGLWVMSFFALRYPVKMLPIFIFEFVWKTIWLLWFGLPQWLSGVRSPRLSEDLFSIGFISIVFGLIIPWGYVWRHYFKDPAERWR